MLVPAREDCLFSSVDAVVNMRRSRKIWSSVACWPESRVGVVVKHRIISRAVCVLPDPLPYQPNNVWGEGGKRRLEIETHDAPSANTAWHVSPASIALSTSQQTPRPRPPVILSISVEGTVSSTESKAAWNRSMSRPS